jgi:transposase-like protein
MSEAEKREPKKSPEVTEKATRRRFSLAYKDKILAEADQCTGSGELGELLRREGLYSSTLSNWRRQRESGTLAPNQRGRKPKTNKNEARELAKLKRENARLTEKLRQAELIIEVQKKVSEMMGINRTEKND